MIVTSVAVAPQLVVQRADATTFWESASGAPLLVSGGGDQPIRFWDARTGTLIRRVRFPNVDRNWAFNEVPPVRLSRDGRSAVARISNNAFVLVDVATTQVRPVTTTLDGQVLPLAFSPDAREILCAVVPPFDAARPAADAEYVARVRLADGHVTATYDGSGDAAYSPDGRSLALTTTAEDGLRIIDLRDGRERRIQAGAGVYGPLVFSPDGATLVSAGDDPSIPPHTNGVYDASSTAHDLVVDVWDVRTGALRRRLPFRRTWPRNPQNENAAGSFAFAGSNVLAISRGATTTFVDLASGLAKTDVAGNPYAVDRGVELIDEHRGPSLDLRFLRWNGRSAEQIADVPAGAPNISRLALDASGTTLAIYSDNLGGNAGSNIALLWKLADRLAPKTIAQPALSQDAEMRFLANGMLEFSTVTEVVRVDPHTNERHRYAVPKALGRPISISMNGDGTIVFEKTGATTTAYDLASGAERYALPDGIGLPIACASHTCALVTSPPFDLAHRDDPATLSLRDDATGTVLHTLSLRARPEAAFAAGGSLLVMRGPPFVRGRSPDSIAIVDVASGAVATSFAAEEGRLTAASRTDRLAVVGDRTTVYDTGGRLVATLDPVDPGTESDVQFVMWPDGSKIAIAPGDGSIVVRDVATGRVDVTFAVFLRDGALEWLAYTPDGYFTGTPFGVGTIRWRIGNRIFPAQMFARRFARPDRVAAALQRDR